MENMNMFDQFIIEEPETEENLTACACLCACGGSGSEPSTAN